MTQDELDRLLKEALDVEPPAGYVARVRARVAAEQATSMAGRGWWPLAALAAAGLVLVAGGLLVERDNSPVLVATVTLQEPETIPTTGNRIEAAPRPAGASAGTPATAVLRSRPRDGTANAEHAMRPADALPAVLISPDDSAGLRLLTTFTEAAVAAPVTGDGAARQISRIDVTPIEVDVLPELTPLVLGELQ